MILFLVFFLAAVFAYFFHPESKYRHSLTATSLMMADCRSASSLTLEQIDKLFDDDAAEDELVIRSEWAENVRKGSYIA